MTTQGTGCPCPLFRPGLDSLICGCLAGKTRPLETYSTSCEMGRTVEADPAATYYIWIASGREVAEVTVMRRGESYEPILQ